MEAAHALRRRLGLLLVDKGVLSTEELEFALDEQRETGELLGDVLIRLGLASRPAIQDALAEQSGVLFEPESGFGSGLRDEIVRRHEERRSSASTPPPPARPAVEGTGRPPDLVAISGGVASQDSVEPPAPEEAPLPIAEPEEARRPLAELEELPRPPAAPEEVPGADTARIDDLEQAVAYLQERVGRLERAPEAASTRGDATEHLLFFRGEGGYEIVGVEGPAPELGEHVVPPGAEHPFAVLKLATAPLPGDPRPCAFLEALPASRLAR